LSLLNFASFSYKILAPNTKSPQKRGYTVKERSASQSRLLLLAPLAESKSGVKTPLGLDTAKNSPRFFLHPDDLQEMFEKIEKLEEKALMSILQELDNPLLDNL
jgi:hypothetical protein